MSKPKRKSIVVVGPSGSGKSTLVDTLRTPEHDQHIVIPKRVITLPIRGDSNPIENRNVDDSTFLVDLEEGRIKPWWSRQFGKREDDVHYYGFEKVPKTDPRTRLYLGNNALLGSDQKSVRKLMERSLVVVVHADPEVRGDRLDERLPDMAQTERATRIADGLERLEVFSPRQIVWMDTTGQPIEASAQQFSEIVLSYAGAIPCPDSEPTPAAPPAMASSLA
jgi:ribose 1,5-bisphosphokinase PhnN